MGHRDAPASARHAAKPLEVVRVAIVDLGLDARRLGEVDLVLREGQIEILEPRDGPDRAGVADHQRRTQFDRESGRDQRGLHGHGGARGVLETCGSAANLKRLLELVACLT